MGEDTIGFENAKKAFAEEKEKFNAEKKGLSWRVADAEQKLAQEKQFNSNKQKEWEIACERTNKELEAQRDSIVRLLAEKAKISDEAKQERVASQKREQEYLLRIAKLEKFAEEKIAEGKASELLAEEVSADCTCGAYGNFLCLNKEECGAAYAAKRRDYEFIEFGIVKVVDKLSQRANAIEVLKKALGDSGTDGGAGPSHQD
ncbi:hypothetical protein Hanom_Chr05g00424691 [Helianthus anomalus]